MTSPGRPKRRLMSRRTCLITAATAIPFAVAAGPQWWVTRRVLIRLNVLGPPANLLRNAGFRPGDIADVPDYWSVRIDPVGSVALVGEGPLAGAGALRLRNDSQNGEVRLESHNSAYDIFEPRHACYVFSVYLRSGVAPLDIALAANDQEPRRHTIDGRWRRYWITCRQPDILAPCEHNLSVRLWIRQHGTVWVSAPQLEAGTRPTPFVPALIDDRPRDRPAKLVLWSGQSPSASEPISRFDEIWWMNRHALNVRQARELQPELIFLGDSITEGWLDAGKDIWNSYDAPRKAMNLGVKGDRIQHVLWRVENGQFDGIRPRVVVLLVGTNNLGEVSPDGIAAGIARVVERLREKLPGTIVLLFALLPRGREPGELREQVRRTNEKLGVIVNRDHLQLLDIGDRFTTREGTIPREVMPDSIHPSALGYRIWAEALEPTLRTLLGTV